jgi:membrane fusion protein (multidrug efflux system)
MANGREWSPQTRQRLRIAAIVAVVALVGLGAWLWITAGQESTDDAQVDGYVTPVAARVGGTVANVLVADNQEVQAGDTLVQLDPATFDVAVRRAKAELADAQAAAIAAQSGVPITTTSTASDVTTAESTVTQASSAATAAERELEAARARQTSAEARVREVEANQAHAAKDVDRLRALVEKNEIPQQQFDTARTAADAQAAALDVARAQATEAEASVRVAESRLTQARAGEAQAQAALRTAKTGPSQVTATQARADAAEARVELARASLRQAELNLEYATVKAPRHGQVSRKSVDVGQVVQAGQPLLALVPLDEVWITANFKETQITNMQPGQRATVEVDAYGGRKFEGHVDSLSAATGARFSLLPPENATGNFVKVVQRVPVKIVLDGPPDPNFPLRPGMSVTPTVYTSR